MRRRKMNELEIVQYSNVEGLHLFLNTVDYRTSHFHPEWELIWILKNSLAVTCHQQQLILQPGELFLFEPNEPHEFHRLQSEATFLCLQLSPKVLPHINHIALESNRPQLFMTSARLKSLKQHLLRLAESYFSRRENYELFCSGAGSLILYDLLQALPHHDISTEAADCIDKRNARLNRLICFVDEHYMEKIRLEDFAAQEQCSTGYLSRFIKATLNQTFREYVASVRFHCACKLIAEGSTSMLDVCMASGFSDYRYFSRAFQENYHMTPEKYSRSIRPQLQTVQHSLHSIERIYSREESLKMLRQYGTLL